MGVFQNPFFVTFLLCLGAYQNKTLVHGQEYQCLILILQFSFRIDQFDRCELTHLV